MKKIINFNLEIIHIITFHYTINSVIKASIWFFQLIKDFIFKVFELIIRHFIR